MSDKRSFTQMSLDISGVLPQLGERRLTPNTPSQLMDLVDRTQKLTIILDIAKAMSATRDLDTLLDLIAEGGRRIVDADRCTIFVLDADKQELWAKVAQGMEGAAVRFPVGRGIAGAVAQSKKALIIQDAYSDARFNQEIDLSTGYRTKNILCVPMLDNEGEISGVLQVLNKKNAQLFVPEDEELLIALGGQAAVALENALLHQDIETLFEGFIKASMYAIEARDPTTSGHSERVASLTVGIARKLEFETQGPYKNVCFTDEVLRELRYAALLHDFGKVGVRENVLLKANKLYPSEFELIGQRFAYVRRCIENRSLSQQIELLQEAGLQPVREHVERLRRDTQAELDQLEAMFELVVQCNRPTILEQGDFARLQQVVEYSYVDSNGSNRPLIEADEFVSLSVPKGSLTEQERRDIEAHVTFTYKFLSRIPWTRDLKNVPHIAHAHHEKLNGAGYPGRLNADAIPIQARMMTIADIYDALTAADRPYKRAVPHEKALDILHMDAKHGAIDAELLRTFIDAEVFKIVQG